MLKLLRGKAFITLMQAIAIMSLFEILSGQNYVDPAVSYAALLLSALGLSSGLFLAAAFKGKR